MICTKTENNAKRKNSPCCSSLGSIGFIFIPSCNRENKVPEPVQQDTIYPLGFCTDSFDLAEGTLKTEKSSQD